MKPCAAIFLMVAEGNSPVSSKCAATGAISFCAKSRAAWRIISCSGLSVKLGPVGIISATAIGLSSCSLSWGMQEFGEAPKVILMQNHGLIALGQTSTEAINVTAMCVKAAGIFGGACAL